MKLGHKVFGLDDLSTGKTENLNAHAQFFELDVRSNDLSELVARIDPSVVYHLAAQISVAASTREPLLDARTNILGTLNLLMALSELPNPDIVRFVHFSSGGTVYGEPDNLPAREDYPLAPLAPYAASKSAIELYLPVFEKLHGIACSTVRLGNVYGPRQDPHGEAGVIAIFTRAMLDNEPMRIFGDGNDERDYVYVDDVVDSLISVGFGDVTGTFNIAGGEGTSPNILFEKLAELCEYEQPAVYVPRRPGDIHKIYLDISKAKRELGWEPKVSLEEGLKRSVDWFRANA